jgi:hypothetical protein
VNKIVCARVGGGGVIVKTANIGGGGVVPEAKRLGEKKYQAEQYPLNRVPPLSIKNAIPL